jgi:hypothetical protein
MNDYNALYEYKGFIGSRATRIYSFVRCVGHQTYEIGADGGNRPTLEA